ncbi:MAG: STAS domain-containing protein [Actinomycetota bacterium]|nr:STAS domain-containing protein [Actinomycetota bacterium]
MDGFGLDVQQGDACVVLSVSGEVDLATAPELRQRLVDLVADGHRRIVVDMSETEFLDSTGLGALVVGLKRLRAHDGEMRVVCTTPRVRKVFEITHVDRVLPLFDSVEQACTS